MCKAAGTCLGALCRHQIPALFTWTPLFQAPVSGTRCGNNIKLRTHICNCQLYMFQKHNAAAISSLIHTSENVPDTFSGSLRQGQKLVSNTLLQLKLFHVPNSWLARCRIVWDTRATRFHNDVLLLQRYPQKFIELNFMRQIAATIVAKRTCLVVWTLRERVPTTYWERYPITNDNETAVQCFHGYVLAINTIGRKKL